MAGENTASAPSWTGPLAGLSPRCFGKLVAAVRREQATDRPRGRPWSLSLEDRVLLVTAVLEHELLLAVTDMTPRGWGPGAKAAVGNTMTIADGCYQGTGLVIPHRRRTGEELLSWMEGHNRAHKQVRARVERVFTRMKSWKILRDCRLKGDGVPHAMLGIARLHKLTLTG
ncbi:transposase family protein [Streptomyces xanthochromogenes]|uniref:transposase family protein n=1 Tax=Streptomyces xanthochromogenes TaxID=67384 RepID=UPI00380D1577